MDINSVSGSSAPQQYAPAPRQAPAVEESREAVQEPRKVEAQETSPNRIGQILDIRA